MPGCRAYSMTPVYPRWRGEHFPILYKRTLNDGLSPLARGTLITCGMEYPHLRFIPAGAGNTRQMTSNLSAISVYPRWRGEHPFMLKSGCCYFGLSPLARGTHWCRDFFLFWFRFIPAGAGNTFRSKAVRVHFTVYPRWRGEHFWTN